LRVQLQVEFPNFAFRVSEYTLWLRVQLQVEFPNFAFRVSEYTLWLRVQLQVEFPNFAFRVSEYTLWLPADSVAVVFNSCVFLYNDNGQLKKFPVWEN